MTTLLALRCLYSRKYFLAGCCGDFFVLYNTGAVRVGKQEEMNFCRRLPISKEVCKYFAIN